MKTETETEANTYPIPIPTDRIRIYWLDKYCDENNIPVTIDGNIARITLTDDQLTLMTDLLLELEWEWENEVAEWTDIRIQIDCCDKIHMMKRWTQEHGTMLISAVMVKRHDIKSMEKFIKENYIGQIIKEE